MADGGLGKEEERDDGEESVPPVQMCEGTFTYRCLVVCMVVYAGLTLLLQVSSSSLCVVVCGCWPPSFASCVAVCALAIQTLYQRAW